MDFSMATEIVRSRVQAIEPALANKIIGYLLLNEFNDLEMIRMAFGPDCMIASLVEEAKSALLGYNSRPISPVSPSAQSTTDFPHKLSSYPRAVSRTLSTPAALHVPSSPYWESQLVADQHLPIHQIDIIPLPYANLFGEEYRLLNQFQLEENMDNGNVMWADFLSHNYHSQEPPVSWEGIGLRTGRRSVGFPESQVKACHYFYKGYCKHGTSCRYFHGQSLPDNFLKLCNTNQNDATSEDSNLSPSSLEKLELEITELLKSQGGQGISIAMLPLLYYEKYGKHLQAEGYLTESQRHGKAGYSLTKLLARLKNSIRIIDRPHGQHSVMLAEDAVRHPEYRSEMSDPGNAVTSSQQIYLTFPAESTFTEEDVSNYFNQFGPVHAVRIPPQQKRMFGFVTFVLPETVKMVLNKGNPHYICGARVLAKPYREKTRNFERKYNEKVEIPMYHPSQHLEVHNRFHSMPRTFDNGVRRQLMEESLAVQMRRLRGLQLAPRQLAQRRCLGYDMEEASLLEDGGEVLSPDCPGSHTQLDALKYNAVSGDKGRSACNNCSHQESQVDLPESPFASPRLGSRISTLV